MMKKANALLAIIALLLGIGALHSYVGGSCDAPIRYSLGDFDPRFGLTEKEFLAVLADAEAIWERESGRELFVYDPQASFRVNLVYDERQAKTEEYEAIKRALENSESTYKTVEEEYKALSAQYDTDLAAYEKAASRFEISLATYNREVDYWNARGGAPEKKYEELKADQRELDRRSDELEAERQELNVLARRISILAERGNRLADSYNETVSTYNQKFGTSTEFDQGDYRGDQINVYQFQDASDLTMVVAHEFGHALGIDHTDDPKSVMHYFMGEQNLNNLKLAADDIAELRAACGA